MAVSPLNPVTVLIQRREFLEGVKEIARLCNWNAEEVDNLTELVWKELIVIDNHMFEIYTQTHNPTLAWYEWETKTEELRQWLSLMFGIKIKYI